MTFAGPRRSARQLVVAAAVALAAPAVGGPVARAGDRDLLAAVRVGVPAVERTARAADGGRGGPDAAQAQYDAARDLAEAVRAAAPVSAGCVPLRAASAAFAAANVLVAEGVDRPWPAMVSGGAARALRARDRIELVRARCRPGPVPGRELEPELDAPRAGEASFGVVRAVVPAGLDRVAVLVDGVRVATLPVVNGVASGRIDGLAPAGSHAISLRSLPGERPAYGATSRDVWLLPGSARARRPEGGTDRALSARLDGLVAGFRGHAAVWIHDLASGVTAGTNAGTRFPAASTVKLGLLLAGLARTGARAVDGPRAHDLAAMTTWSSNLATNRLLRTLGGGDQGVGAALAQAALARVGATRSTFTGGYRVGTGAHVDGAPPLVSARMTTAHDLGRVLYAIHAAALGSPSWLRRTGLTRHEARVALGWLLGSEPRVDNVGLLRPTLGALPIAQKHGWLSTVRHSAGIVYHPGGPRIVVVLTYADGLTRREAAAFAASVLRAARAGV